VTDDPDQELSIQFIWLLDETKQDCWMQQGDATKYIANSTMAIQAEFTGDCDFNEFIATRITDFTSRFLPLVLLTLKHLHE
jgi:hypothetical protein